MGNHNFGEAEDAATSKMMELKCITCNRPRNQSLFKCRTCANVFCFWHSVHKCVEEYEHEYDKLRYLTMTSPRTSNPLACSCCRKDLDFETDEYHVTHKKRYCNRCYTSSHHLNAPDTCPYISVIRRVTDVLTTVHLSQSEADAIKKFVDQRVRT